mmetsp:Transcript_29337/g.68926  ORF Transcript_29337/g.68926 Transcript_29337/m.68926 type:complete len:956 (+) Transcript_29337:428-3295(+)
MVMFSKGQRRAFRALPTRLVDFAFGAHLAIMLLLATSGTSLIHSGRGRRTMLAAVQAFQREVAFARHRNPMGSAVRAGWPLASSTEGGTSEILSNQDILERRLEMNRGKRAASKRSAQERVSRNLDIKRLVHTESSAANNTATSSEFQVPPLYAVKVWVDDELREELKLSGREKRGRVFIETGSEGTKTFRGMKDEIFGFFRALKKNTFVLTANLPQFDEDGNVVAVSHPPLTEDDGESDVVSWRIENDEDVVKTFAMADDFFQNPTTFALKRPSIQISVRKDPNAPPPPPPPAYLKGMPDPDTSESMTMLSFYAFPPSGIEDPEDFAIGIKVLWKPFKALGRIYIATEGVNAQMSVPTNVLSHFMECCRSVPELGQYMENDINIDPKPLSQGEFAVAGVQNNGNPAPPFRNLHIRVRSQVVADGLDKSLDWQSAGYDMPPLEWHEQLKRAREAKDKPVEEKGDLPIVLDCRNTYETNVGIFDGAEPLETENFRDSWDVLKERLADTPKDAPIMTYCTGGIRCVKVGAYLTQEMGFTNVSRLAGGIIAYDRTLNEKKEGEESMFKGTNFVFDGRLGRQITDDELGTCITCGAATSLVSNCRNENCHKRMIQCENCRTTFQGTCSTACKNRLVNGATVFERKRPQSLDEDSEEIQYDNLDEYSMGHSSPVPSVYKEMELNTQSYLASGSHMVSGAAQGRLLTQLASMTRNGRVLELGTFTGYATACLLEGARNVGQVLGVDPSEISEKSGPYVMTMERDSRALNLAAAHLQTIEKYGFEGEEAAEAMCALRSEHQIKEVEDDKVSVSVEGGIARCDLVRVTDALASVEAIATGDFSINDIDRLDIAPFDLVFVDADKTRLLEYVEACLSSDRLLNRGGLIVVDNVLWKGLVLEASAGEFVSVSDRDDSEKAELRKNRRARKLATTMHRFNAAIAEDDRVEVLVLPMRDGLSVIRKK